MSKTADERGAGAERRRGPDFWVVPGFSVAMGVVFLAASWLGGHPVVGVGMFALMLVFALALVLGARRSEFVLGLMSRGDERTTGIDVHASALAGTAVFVAVLVGAVTAMAHGQSGQPYVSLAAIGGVSYAGAAIVLRFRR